MANVNRPSGFSPVKYLNGADWDGRGNIYYINSSDTNAFYVGDPVVLSGDGDSSRGIPGITIATAGSPIVGVVMAVGANPDGGPYIDPSDLTKVYAPATKTKAYYAWVCDDPNVIFEAQENGTALTSADIGLNINFVAGAGNGYISGYTLQNSTKATTSSLNFKLLGLVRRQDNAFGTNAKWLVLPNNHLFKAGVTGV